MLLKGLNTKMISGVHPRQRKPLHALLWIIFFFFFKIINLLLIDTEMSEYIIEGFSLLCSSSSFLVRRTRGQSRHSGYPGQNPSEDNGERPLEKSFDSRF
jgi:hypothetical protein